MTEPGGYCPAIALLNNGLPSFFSKALYSNLVIPRLNRLGSLRAGANLALANRSVDGIIAVGEAWNRAFAEKLADPNPYDGIDFGKLDLWTYDQYHGSVAGYYLEALMIFGKVTGRDPRTLGAKERAADDLGLSEGQAVALQNVAFRQIEAEKTQR